MADGNGWGPAYDDDAGGEQQLTIATGENRIQFQDKNWEILLENVPEDLHIDGIIAVDEPITKSDNLNPGNVGESGTCLRRNSVRCFASHL